MRLHYKGFSTLSACIRLWIQYDCRKKYYLNLKNYSLLPMLCFSVCNYQDDSGYKDDYGYTNYNINDRYFCRAAGVFILLNIVRKTICQKSSAGKPWRLYSLWLHHVILYNRHVVLVIANILTLIFFITNQLHQPVPGEIFDLKHKS